MGHNVWSHINTVQEANRQYTNLDQVPKTLVDERFERLYVREVVDKVFSDVGNADAIVDKHFSILQGIAGSARGYTGKKEVNATTFFGKLFE